MKRKAPESSLTSATAAAPPEGPPHPEGHSFLPVLHSVSYSGIWRGQAQLTLDQFLVKAKLLGYGRVMLVAKRPHLAPADYDEEARGRLRHRIAELGLEVVALAGYTDFSAGLDRPGIPVAESGCICRRIGVSGAGSAGAAGAASCSRDTNTPGFPSTSSGARWWRG